MKPSLTLITRRQRVRCQSPQVSSEIKTKPPEFVFLSELLSNLFSVSEPREKDSEDYTKRRSSTPKQASFYFCTCLTLLFVVHLHY